jgi:hypothetical protein
VDADGFALVPRAIGTDAIAGVLSSLTNDAPLADA